MSDLLLVIDVGNTTIECGLFDGEQAVAQWRVSSAVPRLADEYWQLVSFFARERDIDPVQIKRLAIASVVPEHTRSLVIMARERFDSRPLVVTSESYPYPVRLSDPRTVGADRLCNAVAGYARCGGPLVVVDFGTAITLDVVAGDGAYLGGVIVPGPTTAAQALHRRTAQLPEVALQFPESVIGLNSELAISSGITWGVVDMVDGLIERINRELKTEVKVITTGGYGAEFAKHSRRFGSFQPGLVLEGIRLIYQYHLACK